ncbi:putative bifunctional diguanylate cyclase/phosphodiesterase [Cellulomonas hominis]
MQAAGSTWIAVVQLILAGLVGGFCSVHWVWWRVDPRQTAALWTLLWSLALALLLLTGGLADTAPDAAAAPVLLGLRAPLAALSVPLALPTIRAFARMRSVRPWVLVTAALLLTRLVLLHTTTLVTVSSEHHGLAPGPLDAATTLAPVGVVITYLLRTMRQREVSRGGHVLTAVGALSVVALAGTFVVASGPPADTLRVLWPVPVALALGVAGVRRLREQQLDARREHQMRDAVARVSNAAWIIKDPDALLLRARDEARALLRDDSIEGSLRALAHGRYVAELFSGQRTATSADEQDFLLDLARIIAAAAERHDLSDQLNRAAFTDALTRLPNRPALDRRLAEALQHAATTGSRVAVLYSDLDGFKQANDQRGHAWGDALLVRVADHLRRTVTGSATVGRLGGDEFVAVLPDAPDDAQLLVIAQRVRAGMPEDPTTHSAPLLSVGVATWEPRDRLEPETLLRHADMAMLEAKRTRRGVVLFDRALRQRVIAENRLRETIDQAVSQGRFLPHYQPIAMADTLDIVGLEALARWQTDEGTLAPAHWLPLAEETGLIVPIGRAILAAARSDLRYLGLPVAVNVAARQLSEPSFLQQVVGAWGDGAWDLLTLEVTESSLLNDRGQAVQVLAELRARGARIALDDFGTGYSSLSRLARLPIDVLKIDREFVTGSATEPGRAVLRAMVQLAAAHGLDVVAEGVETPQQLAVLLDLGVARIQGHLVGQATSARALYATGRYRARDLS